MNNTIAPEILNNIIKYMSFKTIIKLALLSKSMLNNINDVISIYYISKINKLYRDFPWELYTSKVSMLYIFKLVINNGSKYLYDSAGLKMDMDRIKYWYDINAHVGIYMDEFYGRWGRKVVGILHRIDGPAIEAPQGQLINMEWYKNGNLHRDNDKPAIEWVSGYKAWYKNGQRHRINGPAVIYANGDKQWYRRDIPHRMDGPAYDYMDGYKAWYQYGKLHRDNDEPAIEFANGDKSWYRYGLKHRDKGAAIMWNNCTEWYKYNVRYTEDGNI